MYARPLPTVPIPIGQIISDEVKRFAGEEHLKYELWYHDEPLWLIWREEESGIIRRVQIGPYDTANGLEIWFIPAARTATPPVKTTKAIQDEQIQKVSLGIIVEPSAIAIREALHKSWQEAEAFTESELTYDLGWTAIQGRQGRQALS